MAEPIDARILRDLKATAANLHTEAALARGKQAERLRNLARTLDYAIQRLVG